MTFFNQQLAEDNGLGDIYALVENGGWTLDKLLELGGGVSRDIDGNGIYDANDAYGLSCQNDAAYILLNAGNLKICDTDSNGSVIFTLSSEKAVSALQKIYALMTDSMKFFNRQEQKEFTLADAINMFNDNRALFLIRPVQSLFMMRNMQSDFGILPVPMLSEDQESYGSAVNPYAATILTLPKSVSDPERNAAVLQYMAYQSYLTVNGALYETVLGSKLIRDENSVKMLDASFDSRVYDIGLIWNFGKIVDKMLKYRSTDVSSMIASAESSVQSSIDSFNELLRG